MREVNNFYDILIEFHNTGHVQRISTVAIKNNTVTDWSTYSEEKCIERMQLKRPEFDFSEFKYSSSKTKSTVKCQEHGAWETSYEKIMAGQGCPRCRGYYQTTDEVVHKLKSVHGDNYDFSKVKYVKSSQEVEVICPTHGPWFATVKTLLKGHGCRKCSAERNAEQKRSNTEEFVAKAKKVHGDKYTYDATEYVSVNQKVSIFCNKHKEYFFQTPRSHLGGNGCPTCGRTGFDQTMAGSFYVLESKSLVKVGITNRDTVKRLKEINSESPERFSVVLDIGLDGWQCRELETRMLRWLGTIAKPAQDKFQRSSECFMFIDSLTVQVS